MRGELGHDLQLCHAAERTDEDNGKEIDRRAQEEGQENQQATGKGPGAGRIGEREEERRADLQPCQEAHAQRQESRPPAQPGLRPARGAGAGRRFLPKNGQQEQRGEQDVGCPDDQALRARGFQEKAARGPGKHSQHQVAAEPSPQKLEQGKQVPADALPLFEEQRDQDRSTEGETRRSTCMAEEKSSQRPSRAQWCHRTPSEGEVN